MHSQKPPGVVQNWSTLQCSKQDICTCGSLGNVKLGLIWG